MGIGVSIILIAVGAVLAWAVHATSSSFDVNTVGYILLAVGIAGLLLSLMFWSSWAGPGYFTRRRVVSDGYGPDGYAAPATRRRVVEDEEVY